MKKVLVTGGLGYVGSRLTSWLAPDFECTVWDPGFFDDCLLPPKALSHGDCKLDAAEWIRRDVREITNSDLEPFDAVVHLAGISNDPFGNFGDAEVYDPTREYSLGLAKQCKLLGKHLIFASSCSIYGRQPDQNLCDESTTPNPQTAYSRNKLEIETDLKSLAGNGFFPTILRFATAFGFSPRMRFDIVVNMFAALALARGKVVLNSDGKAWRPHICIDDMCRAIAWSLQLSNHDEMIVLNVGRNDQNQTILRVAQAICEIVDCDLEFLNPADAAEHDLIRDRKVQDGADSRTYRVGFERIANLIPEFAAANQMTGQLEQLIADLRSIPLDGSHVDDHRFYRLQRYEWLLKNSPKAADILHGIGHRRTDQLHDSTSQHDGK